jgi:hypothetical protein
MPMSKRRELISCDQCQMLSINGVPCHETGCPNMHARWEHGEWIKYYACFECGCDVREGDECECQNPID